MIAGGIEPARSVEHEITLFAGEETAEHDRGKRLMAAMDRINRQYGSGAIRIAAENAEAWKPSQARLSPCYTTSWNDIITVSR